MDAADDFNNILVIIVLVGTIADKIAGAFDSQAQPVDPCGLEFIEKFILYRIDPCIGLDIDVVIAFYQQITNSVYMALVENKHLIDKLDILDPVFFDQKVNLANNGFRTPHSV